MSKRKAFLQGTLILAATNLIVKLIGAFYTIPLARLIGAEGMGLYNSAYQIYMWLFIVSTTGLPIAISKLVSEEIAIGNMKEAHRVFRVSFVFLIILGIFSALVLYFGAGFFASAIGANKAYFSLIAIAPCLFFVSIMSAYRGYFQGMQNMVPTALSELIEALVRTILGFGLAYIMLEQGIEYSSAAAVLGVSLGGFAGMLILLFIYNIKKGELSNLSNKTKQKIWSLSVISISIKVIKVALPITIGASVFSIASLIDLTMAMRRLKEIGFSEVEAVKLYGYLSGYAYKIYSIPTTFTTALAVSIVPIIAGSFIKKNINSVKKITETGLKMSSIVSIPAAVGIGILAPQILKLLFNDDRASLLLIILSIAITFVSIVQVSGAILQGIGRVMIPVNNLIIGSIVKVSINYILIGIPSINILGATIGTAICYLVVAVLNLIYVKKAIGLKYSLTDIFVKPVTASVGMGIAVFYSYNYMYFHWQSNGACTLLSILIGLIVYSVLILFIGGIKKDDLGMLPSGTKVSDILFRTGLLRQ